MCTPRTRPTGPHLPPPKRGSVLACTRVDAPNNSIMEQRRSLASATKPKPLSVRRPILGCSDPLGRRRIAPSCCIRPRLLCHVSTTLLSFEPVDIDACQPYLLACRRSAHELPLWVMLAFQRSTT